MKELNDLMQTLKQFAGQEESTSKEQLPPELVTDELADRVAANIKAACFSYWDEHSQWELPRKLATFAAHRLCDADGNPVDLSDLLDMPVSQFCTEYGYLQIMEHNPFIPPMSPFAPELETLRRQSTQLGGRVEHALMDAIRGHCLLHEMQGYDYATLFWGPLQEVCACPHTDKRHFYKPFIYSDAFVTALMRNVLAWLGQQSNWTGTLRSVLAPPRRSAAALGKDPMEIEYIKRSKRGTTVTQPLRAGESLLLAFKPYRKDADPFFEYSTYINGEHDEDDLYNAFTDSTGGDASRYGHEFDEAALRKTLQEEAVSDSDLTASVIEEIIEESRAEAAEIAKDAEREFVTGAPLKDPCEIVEATVQVRNEQGTRVQVFTTVFTGEFKPSLGTGYAFDVLDEMSQDFLGVARHFEDCRDEDRTVVYVEGLAISTETSYKDLAGAIGSMLDSLESFIEVESPLVILRSDLLWRCYPGRPYRCINELRTEYVRELDELLEAFAEQGLECELMG